MALGAVRSTSRSFWAWVEHHHIDALGVLGITLWLTFDVMGWAMEYAEFHADKGASLAAIIGAVLTPWALIQGAMFKFYLDLRGKSNGTPPEVKP